MKIELSTKDDGEDLAELRVLAMKESLEAIGRFDPDRAKKRFLDGFKPEITEKVYLSETLVGFFVLRDKNDHLYLDHLYITPSFQGSKIGSKIITIIKHRAKTAGKPLRLGALKGSRSNDFYTAHGFEKTHEEEYDNYYQFIHS